MRETSVYHPSPERLSAFGLGQLSEAESAEVEAHIEGCAACRAAVASVTPDTLVGLLHGGNTARDPSPAESVQAEAPPGPPELADHPRYRILSLLGSGGMGTVYKAQHRLMDRPVALKVISRKLTSDADAVARFRREVMAAARLSHPNVVAAHDAERAGELHFLVMEYIEGQSLARLVAQKGPLGVAEACDYARQAALGLQHAHEHGMIHRDVKPQNLMRTAGGVVKVLDFGLARLAGPAEAAPLTQAGVVLGTPDYMAPERAGSLPTADIRADIYSLGCTLYFLLAGHPPFPEGTFVQKLANHLERMPPPLTAVRPDVPAELSRVVQRMLAKDPARRFQTPAQVARALELFVQPAAPRRRHRTVVAVAAGLLAAVLGGLAVYRVATDKGELEIRTDDPDVQVVIEKGGNQVTVLDLKTKQKIELRSGEYTLQLGKGASDLRLSTDRVTLSRGDRPIVEVRRLPATAGPKRTEIIKPSRSFEGHTAHVTSVTLSSDGKLALSGSKDKSVRLWDTATGKQLHRFPDHQETVQSVAFARDGRLAASGGGGEYQGSAWNPGRDHDIRVWDVPGRKQYRELHGHTAPVLCLAFSPDGRRLVSGDFDGMTRLWDVDANKELLKPLDGCSPWGAVAFHSGAPLVLCTGPANTARLWNLTTGNVVCSYPGHRRAIRAVAFSPDGRLTLTSSLHKTVRVWDVATGQELLVLPHSTVVNCVAFSADGRWALCSSGSETTGPNNDAGTIWAGKDNFVHVWNFRTETEAYRLEGHEIGVNSVAVSADGRFVLSGGAVPTLLLWTMP
jgi:WD40 repeat protein